MDILPQYERQQREKPRPDFSFHSRKILGDAETPRMILWIMRLSRGFVKTERQAAYVLLGFCAIVVIAAFAVFAMSFRVFPSGRRLSNEELKKQLEDYKKIQPF